MNYAEIKEYDIANGPGIRLCLFVSGCTHHCPGCFNQQTWDFGFGEPYTEETEQHLLDLLDDPSYQGLTLLGGEPMEPANQRALLPLFRRFKEAHPEKDIWLFTGYLFDRDLLGWESDNKEQRLPKTAIAIPETPELLSFVDVVVDGEFMQAKKDITLLYKGSANQRTIDVPRSLAERKVVIWDPGDVSISAMSHL